MKAFIYYNLHNHCWSVMCRDRELYGKVIAHAREIIVCDAKFVVREAGRLRVIEEQRKNVHAGVVGRITSWSGADLRYPLPLGVDINGSRIAEEVLAAKVKLDKPLVSYNPYFAGHFYTKPDKQPIYEADVVGMYADRSVRI